MKNLSINLWAAMLLSFFSCELFANTDSTWASAGVNDHSLLDVNEEYIMWKRTLWRSLDLREPRNSGFFGEGQEITTTILEAALSGKINAYTSDSLSSGKKLSVTDLYNNLKIPYYESAYSPSDLAYLDDESYSQETDFYSADSNSQEYFTARDIYLIEIKENLVFDRERSRMYNDVLSFKLVLSSDHPLNMYGIDKTIGVFSYKELVEKVFTQEHAHRYYKTNNLSHPVNFHEAMLMHWYFAPIVKLNNAENLYLSDQCDCSPKEVLWNSLQIEYNLLEFESDLWKTFE